MQVVRKHQTRWDGLDRQIIAPVETIHTGEHVPPPEPVKNHVELVWIGAKGKELEIFRRDTPRLAVRTPPLTPSSASICG
jgi:hypothetical protein